MLLRSPKLQRKSFSSFPSSTAARPADPALCPPHQALGFPATQLFERAGPIADVKYHNSGDLSDRPNYDFDQVRSISKVAVSSHFASAKGEERSLTFESLCSSRRSFTSPDLSTEIRIIDRHENLSQMLFLSSRFPARPRCWTAPSQAGDRQDMQ